MRNPTETRARRLLPALFMGAILIAGSLGAGVAQAAAPQSAAGSVSKAFANPSTQAKPMLRWWFPDAGAGASAQGLKMVDQNIRQLAAAGFGGVEVAFLADRAPDGPGPCCDAYTNAQAKTVGFGSPNWQKIVQQILTTANSIPGGFQVDFTASTHWPVAFNNIDPNDEGQQQQATSAYTKITADDLSAETMALPMPAERTTDQTGTPFLFVDQYSAATILRVASLSGGQPTFELASAVDVSGQTTETKNPDGSPAGHAAGIPDAAYAAAHGLDYATDIVAKWGPEPADPNFTGKIDSNGDRRRMADWQYEYQTDLSAIPALSGYTPSAGSDLAVGDYVLFGSYHQGTGQVRSGGSNTMQYNREYAISVYSQAGTQSLMDFWDSNILSRQITNLLKVNATKNPSAAIFEDSFELSRSGPVWTADLLSQMSTVNGYGAAQYAPLLALGSATRFDDTSSATRILEDYTLTLADMFQSDHIAGIKDWAKTFGYTFREQAEAGSPGIMGSEPTLGVQEGDNGATLDAWRNLAGSANLNGTKLVSDEAVTFTSSYTTPWATDARLINTDWASGANRVIMHGSPFARTFDLKHSAWPGWEFDLPFPGGGALGVFAPRQTYWADMGELTGYIARTQAVAQSGQAKVDLALLEGTNDQFSFPSGSNRLQDLLDHGYSYNIVTEAMLNLPNAVVSHGVLDAGGPAYKAVVVDATELTVAGVNKLIDYAQAGLPVIFYNSNVTRVFGTDKPNNNDTLLAQRLAVLQGTPNVYDASSQADIATILEAHDARSAASYSAPNLLALHRVDQGRDLYYLFSAGTTISAAANAGDTGLRLSSTAGLQPGDKLSVDIGASNEVVTIDSIPSPAPAAPAPNVLLAAPLTKAHAVPGGGFFLANPGVNAEGMMAPAGVSAVVDEPITLAGSGQPYLLDAWTGDATAIANYTNSDGTVTFDLTLEPQQAVMVATNVPGTAKTHATSTTSGDVQFAQQGNGLVLRTTEAGTYDVALSDGSVATVTAGDPTTVDLSGGWTLKLQSWGPDPAANATDPTISSKTNISFGANALGYWDSLPATSAQLTKLGVSGMDKVSGIGWYSTSFDLPNDWSPSSEGALLQLDHGADMVVGVTINGHAVDQIDQLTDIVDAGPYLQGGTNSITVKLDSQFGNRTGLSPQHYGLIGVDFMGYELNAIR